MNKILDETKFSNDSINKLLLQRNKERKYEPDEEEQIQHDCLQLTNALKTMVNDTYYTAMVKNRNPKELYGDPMILWCIGNNQDAKYHCGIDLPQLSEELSNRMKETITISFNPFYFGTMMCMVKLKRRHFFG